MHEGICFQPGSSEGSFDHVSKLYAGRHDVYKATLAGTVYALKEYSLADGKDKRKLLKEAKMLQKLEHPCIVEINSVVFSHGDGLRAYIQQPYYEGGDMRRWLAEQTPSADQMKAVLREIVRGVEHLHTRLIVHCDLKLENVFM